MIQIMEEPIRLQQLIDSLRTSTSGSVVAHIAIVRPSSEGRPVSIEYQADKGEAEQELAHIAGDIQAKGGIEDIALCRRLGKLNIGDAILVAVVAAPHRKEAFQACAEAVERMRNMASVKRKEILV